MGDRRDKSKKTRILVVDDHPLVRERLREVLEAEPDLMVCGEAEERRQAVEMAESTQAELMILDLSLKHSHGLDVIKDLRVRRPELPILVLTVHDESLHAERVIRAGAHGYINKQEATRKILEAVRVVLAGDIYLSQTQISLLASRLAGRRRVKAGFLVDTLTDRELRVFELLGQGVSTRQIATQLQLDMRTVETYRARIKQKLHLQGASELLQRAIHWVQGGGSREAEKSQSS